MMPTGVQMEQGEWIDLRTEGMDIPTLVVIGIGVLLTGICYLLLTQPSLRRSPFQILPAGTGIPALVTALLPVILILGVGGLVRINRFHALVVAPAEIRLIYPLGSVTLGRDQVDRANLTLAGRSRVDVVVRDGEQRYRSVAFPRSDQERIGALVQGLDPAYNRDP